MAYTLSTIIPVRSKERRWGVRINDEHLPWPLTFWFLPTEEGPWQCLGLEVGAMVTTETDLDTVKELDPTIVAREVLSKKLPWYIDLCRRVLEGERNSAKVRGSLVTVRQRRRRIDEPFLRRILDEHAQAKADGRPPVTTIARSHGVDTSAASRWIKKAMLLVSQE